jgi:hypothetical protein
VASKKKIPAANNSTYKVGGELVTTCDRLGPVINDLIRAGMTPSRAAEAAGLAKSTVSGWIKRGIVEQQHIENGGEPNISEKPYLTFVEGMVKAEAEAMGGLVLSWFKEARAGDWKAAERFLARRWPQEWGDNNTVKLEVTAGMGFVQPEVNQDRELVETNDQDRKRAILEALVESGDLPPNVLSAWDGEDEDIIDAEIVENKE